MHLLLRNDFINFGSIKNEVGNRLSKNGTYRKNS